MRAWNGFIKTIFLLGLVLICFANPEITAQGKTVITDRKPVILLQEIIPWIHEGADKAIWKLGFLNPAFVLYDDGLVIFKKGRDQFTLFSVELTSQEMNSLLEEFKIDDEFVKLEDFYYTNRQLDQPLYSIKYWQGQKLEQVKVVGPIRDGEEDRKNAPPAFLKLFDKMISFDHQNARLWQPEKVEIHLYPYTNSQGEPVPWPKEWPDLNHPTTRENKDDSVKYSYTIYLDGKKKDDLERMLVGLKEKQAVLINEKQWFIAPQRYILPGEELWIKN
jgi:hypothetical protein